jgi:hypothetical protein
MPWSSFFACHYVQYPDLKPPTPPSAPSVKVESTTAEATASANSAPPARPRPLSPYTNVSTHLKLSIAICKKALDSWCATLIILSSTAVSGSQATILTFAITTLIRHEYKKPGLEDIKAKKKRAVHMEPASHQRCVLYYDPDCVFNGHCGMFFGAVNI